MEKNKSIISIFAGSRKSEITILVPILVNFIKLMNEKYSDFTFVFHSTKEYFDLPKSLTCAGFLIREYDKEIPSNLTAEQILIRSGNIGSVRIGQKIGQEKFKSFLSKIGVLDEINFDIKEVGKPLKFNWGKCPLATASFGHDQKML